MPPNTSTQDDMVGVLKDMSNDITKNPSFQYIMRARVHDDESAIILKGHLLIEYLLNRIIERKCKKPNKILKDPRSYTFSVKPQIVYSMGLLPDYVYENIVRVNQFRNKLAHNLEVDIDPKQMTVVSTEGKTITVPAKGRRYPERFYLKLLSHAAISDLTRHMIFELHIDPRFTD